jgi:hypothetical protein
VGNRDHARTTGLLPDFVQFDRGSGSYKPAQAGFLEGNNDGAYFYNSGRIPWRFGSHSFCVVLFCNVRSSLADLCAARQASVRCCTATRLPHNKPRECSDGSPLNKQSKLATNWVLPLRFEGISFVKSPQPPLPVDLLRWPAHWGLLLYILCLALRRGGHAGSFCPVVA